MAIRRQFFEYSTLGTTPAIGGVVNIFVNLTKATQTKATEFVVINDFGAYASNGNVANGIANAYGAFIQIQLGTTGYFVRPDGIGYEGVHSWALPYPPRDVWGQGDCFDLFPDIYVLPGQNWNVVLTFDLALALLVTDNFRAYVQYTLYDNADSQFAVDLYKRSINITPDNLEWYKRKILKQTFRGV